MENKIKYDGMTVWLVDPQGNRIPLTGKDPMDEPLPLKSRAVQSDMHDPFEPMRFKGRMAEVARNMQESLSNISKTLKTMETKKIIGYKLKNEKYRKAYDAVVNIEYPEFGGTRKSSEEYQFKIPSAAFNAVKKAGVLDLWFEPVYEYEGGIPMDYTGWLKFLNQSWLKYFEDGKMQYGFTNLGGEYVFEKYKTSLAEIVTGYRRATFPEIERALVYEANRRGFKEGVSFKFPNGGACINPEGVFHYDHVENKLYLGDGGVVFDNGKWGELFKHDLEVGTWYYLKKAFYTGTLLNYRGKGKNHYGWNVNGVWTNEFGNAQNIELLDPVPANDYDVKEAYIRELRKRDFYKGAKYHYPHRHNIPVREFEDQLTVKDGNLLDGSNYICLKGEWAEVILNSLPTISGYKGVDKGNYIKWGCVEVPKFLIRGFDDLGVLSFKKSLDGKVIEINPSQLAKVYNYLDKEK